MTMLQRVPFICVALAGALQAAEKPAVPFGTGEIMGLGLGFALAGMMGMVNPGAIGKAIGRIWTKPMPGERFPRIPPTLLVKMNGDSEVVPTSAIGDKARDFVSWLMSNGLIRGGTINVDDLIDRMDPSKLSDVIDVIKPMHRKH